jgi:hypothetical protein
VVKEDYENFVPEVDRQIARHGRVRMLMDMHDFHGWSAGAMWADTKFAVKHYRGIERLAIIGEKKWQRGMATFCKPFTKAEIRYFDHSQAEEVHEWLGLEAAVTK